MNNTFTVYDVIDKLMTNDSKRFNPMSNDSRYELLFCLDNGEIVESDRHVAINESTADGNSCFRRNYVTIRNADDKRTLIRLWGHKDSIGVELSKQLRKKADCYHLDNIDSKLFSSCQYSKNNNPIATTLEIAVDMCEKWLAVIDSNYHHFVAVAETVQTVKETTTQTRKRNRKAK